jgi:hypothetical protein
MAGTCVKSGTRPGPDNRGEHASQEYAAPPASAPTVLCLRRDEARGAEGEPGRYPERSMGPVVLAERLQAIGIEPRAMRDEARTRLTAEIQPALPRKLNARTRQTQWAAVSAPRRLNPLRGQRGLILSG